MRIVSCTMKPFIGAVEPLNHSAKLQRGEPIYFLRNPLGIDNVHEELFKVEM